MAQREIKVAIIGDPSSLQRALSTADRGVSTFSSRMSRVGDRLRTVGSSMSRNLTLPLVGFGILAARELSAGERALAQTQAVIESTGAAAGKSVQDIVDLSASLSDLTSLDDEPIQEAANTLLTFQRIAGDTFDEATRATLDLSVAMDRDLRGSAVMVGRALNDPVRGMAALTRVGVQFSDEQRAAVEAMVAFGDTAGAQRLILNELNTEFGGSAEALGGTFTGRLNRVRNRFEAMGASILEDLLPVMEDLAGVIESLADAYDRLTPTQQKVVAGLVVLAFVAGPLLTVLGGIASAIGGIAAAMGVAGGTVGILVVAFVALGVALYVLYRNWSTATSMASSFFRMVGSMIPEPIRQLAVLAARVFGIVNPLGQIITYGRQAFSALSTLGSIGLQGIITAFQALTGGISAAAQSASNLLSTILQINSQSMAKAPIATGGSSMNSTDRLIGGKRPRSRRLGGGGMLELSDRSIDRLARRMAQMPSLVKVVD